ncbi:MAG TPA: DUF2182 domain-containing protein [Casimicrobiaceae bacterium]
MGAMPMPGGATMPMAAMSSVWVPMAGQTWPAAAASFLAMWMVMMVPMMLPVLTPTLWQYRQMAAASEGVQRMFLTGLVGVAYFSVWTVIGLVAFAAGAVLAGALATAQMHSPEAMRAARVAAGIAVIAAGVFQFTPWKARELACCRSMPAQFAMSSIARTSLSADMATAFRHGARLGFHCVRSCAGLTAILLVTGVMDVRVMALVATAITAERLSPPRWRVSQAIGGIAVATGALLIVRAIA